MDRASNNRYNNNCRYNFTICPKLDSSLLDDECNPNRMEQCNRKFRLQSS